MGFRRFVAVVVVLLGISGCTVNQHALDRALDHFLETPPVDVRAVPGGVEVGFVCGAAAPWYSDLSVNQTGATISHHDYKSKTPVRSVTIAVPKSMRHSELAVAVATPRRDANLSLGLYVATFRYDQLPTATAKRVPGASCGRPGTTTTTTVSG